MKVLDRVVLEMSLKPFSKTDAQWLEKTCREVFHQWGSLLSKSRSGSLLMWVSDGSELLTWKGDLNESFEWARYIGFCNTNYHAYTGNEFSPERVAKFYVPDPPVMTYGLLKTIVQLFKQIAKEELDLELSVGATFDPGPEFAYSKFKYQDHPEIIVDRYNSSIGETIAEVHHASKLHGDNRAYAAFPNGIKEGTSFGTFLGKQAQSFLSALGFDYIWFSNGFAFTPYPWTMLGDNFDGTQFGKADAAKARQELIRFWEDFTAQCSYPIEVRGTNFSTGIDLAKDCISLADLYKYIKLPPPNSPWGALNFDFGLELAGYMSRIAKLPAEDYMFRYYINDPWFWQNPWFDLYERQPFDLYCPLATSRLNEEGKVQNPKTVQFLAIDNSRGELPEECPREVIPHLLRAVQEAPDKVGPVTWLYPFTEYHELYQEKGDSALPFFGDFLVRSAINSGFPLNTVVNTENFRKLLAEKNQGLFETVLFALVPQAGTYEGELCQFVEAGGKVILYGPLTDAEAVGKLLQIELASPISGELELEFFLETDRFREEGPSKFRHDPSISAGGIGEILAGDDGCTEVEAVVRQGKEERVYALSRSLPSWNGGRVSWVRGSLPFSTKREPGEELRMPKDYPQEYIDASVLPRYQLSKFGYRLRQVREDAGTPASLLLVSRNRNSFIFTGCQTNQTTELILEFPDGAPVVAGREVPVAGREAAYIFPRTIRENCCVFVEQKERSVVACRERAPFPTGKQRRLLIANLRGATVTVYPPLDRMDEFLAEENGIKLEEDRIERKREKIILHNIEGSLEIAW